MRRATICGILALTLFGCGDDDSSSMGTESVDTTGVTPSTSTATSPSSTQSGDPMTGGSTSPSASSSGGDTESSSGSTGPGAQTTGGGLFTLTSTTFEQGGLFPTTMHIVGGNEHPELSWTNAPASALSFGVYFEDTTISYDHSAIWNIGADVTGLPENIEWTAMPASVPGSVQAQHWASQNANPLLDYLGPPPRYGYGGPGSDSNVYEFTIYALDVATLDGEIDSESELPDVRAAFEAHMIDSATLSGQSQGAG